MVNMLKISKGIFSNESTFSSECFQSVNLTQNMVIRTWGYIITNLINFWNEERWFGSNKTKYLDGKIYMH